MAHLAHILWFWASTAFLCALCDGIEQTASTSLCDLTWKAMGKYCTKWIFHGCQFDCRRYLSVSVCLCEVDGVKGILFTAGCMVSSAVIRSSHTHTHTYTYVQQNMA